MAESLFDPRKYNCVDKNDLTKILTGQVEEIKTIPEYFIFSAKKLVSKWGDQDVKAGDLSLQEFDRICEESEWYGRFSLVHPMQHKIIVPPAEYALLISPLERRLFLDNNDIGYYATRVQTAGNYGILRILRTEVGLKELKHLVDAVSNGFVDNKKCFNGKESLEKWKTE